MIKEVQFQIVGKKNWEAVQKIALKTFKNTYESRNDPEHFQKYLANAFSERKIKSELNNPLTYFFFAKTKDTIVGYFKLNKTGAQSDLNIPNSLEIERIYVLEQYKGKGIGRKMIEFVMAFAEKQDLKEVWLGVWDQNMPAIAFYNKMGFQKFGTHSFMMGNDEQSDYLLKLTL